MRIAPPTGMGLQRDLPATFPKSDHAIVVFGTPLEADGTLGPRLSLRMDKALELELAVQHPDAVLVVSGGAVHTEQREALVMRTWLMERGISSRRIVVEPEARFTQENAIRVMPLLEVIGAKKVTLVTEEFHMARSRGVMDAC